MNHRPIVVRASEGYEAEAATVAAELGLPLAPDTAACEGAPLVLLRDTGGWALTDGSRGAPVRADFLSGPLAHRIREAPRGEGRLLRAMGLRHRDGTTDAPPLVLDATAGLGRETMLAAALGCTVIACERSPIVALLLRDGIERAAAHGLAHITGRVTLRNEDARDVLAALAALPGLAAPPASSAGRPDVVLVDPMFPERSKAAKARREMQLLQALLGPDDDAAALLEVALQVARRRVVVKRPSHAPPVGGRAPSFAVEGRAARYDVYVSGAIQPA